MVGMDIASMKSQNFEFLRTAHAVLADLAGFRAMTDRLEPMRATADGLFESLVARAFQTSKES